jgi:hypothetical protein
MTTSVFFWGGYLSSDNDMKVWLDSAKAQGPKIDFNAFAWPPDMNAAHDSDGDRAVEALKDKKHSNIFPSWVDTIDASKADLIYVIGHSSGCAVANAVHLALKDTSKVILVCLDGYKPQTTKMRDQLKPPTQIWSARCDGKKSLRYKEGQPPLFQYYEPTNCAKDATEWSLHFSLVNTAASAVSITNSQLSLGYKNCKANLCWLTKQL